jgi:hypothetical protein
MLYSEYVRVRCRTNQHALRVRSVSFLYYCNVSRFTGIDMERSYIKPAPPVTIIFLISGRGSNLVLPVRTGV